MFVVKPRNYNKVPKQILIKAKQFYQEDFVVGCLLKITNTDIIGKKYEHLGITLENEEMNYKSEVLPNKYLGRYSKINREGIENKIHKLPKIDKIIYSEAPNFKGNGTHSTSRTIKALQREIINPKEFTIKLKLLEKTDENFVFSIYVEEILNRNDQDLNNKLLYNVNLLRESIGNEDIISVDADITDYIAALVVDWEILPVGEGKETYTKLLSSFKYNDAVKKKLDERYDTLLELKPKEFIKGSSGFRRYFGAKINDNLIIFENLEYGNALYIMYEEWETLCKLNRMQLININSNKFDRIEHRKTWKTALKMIVENKR